MLVLVLGFVVFFAWLFADTNETMVISIVTLFVGLLSGGAGGFGLGYKKGQESVVQAP